MPAATKIDKELIREVYEEVRSNSSSVDWAVFKFEGTEIICQAKGAGFDDFQQQFNDDERAFAYIRIQMGDEMSKRSKFLFLTWIGGAVGVMQSKEFIITNKNMNQINYLFIYFRSKNVYR